MINDYAENNWSVTEISMDKFNLNPGKFCMSFGFDLNPLESSIRKAGIINKPLITSDSKGNIEIVAGYRRILALKRMKISSVFCSDLTGSDKTDFEMMMINIHDNLYARNLNNIEKSMALNRLKSFLKTEKIDSELIRLLEINKRELDTLLKLDSLSESIKSLIMRNAVSLKALEKIMGFQSDRDCQAVLDWIDKIKLNFNQQIQFIEYTGELSRLNKITRRQVLMADEYRQIYDDEKMNNPQKGRKLLNHLRKRLFPDLTRYERIFTQRVNQLKLPGDIKISHSEYFESEGYRLEIEFRDGRSLKRHIEYLQNAEGLEKIGDPWK